MKPKSASTPELISPSGVCTRILKGENGTPLLNYTIAPFSLPELPKRPGRRILHYHEAVARQWRTYWETDGLTTAKTLCQQKEAAGKSFSPLQVSLNTTVCFQSDTLLCIRQDEREDTGTEPSNSVLHAVVWDVQTGTPLPMAAFFPKNRRWKREVREALRDAGATMEASGEYLLDPSAGENFIRFFSLDRYLLTEHGLSVWYPQNTVAAPAEGVLLIPLPFPFFDPCNDNQNHV